MNTFCHSTIAARIETAAAAIILFLTTLTSCGRSSSPEPLDQWNDGTSTLHTADPVIAEGRKLFNDKEYQNFRLTGEALTQPGSEAGLLFHTDGESGYEVIFRNGDIDGTRKSGSLASVRNLYRSLAKDGEWFDFEITVRGQNIIVCINGTEVVCYTEPGHPYRTEEHARQLLSQGSIALQGIHGEVSFRNLAIERLAKEARNEADTLAPVDERTDEIIRLQQHDFPVIDYHVHLKGGLTKEMAHAMSMNYGINYGVAPNAGEGGVGRMLADDKEVYDYFNEVKGMPFLCGVQGEGRKWTATFSQEALGIFDYLFTDAMTIIDHKGRNSRIYRAEEALFDDITLEQYMDHLVDQTVLILTNEPADIYANPTFLPDTMAHDYDKYWTDGRIERVLDVLQQHGIALEITLPDSQFRDYPSRQSTWNQIHIRYKQCRCRLRTTGILRRSHQAMRPHSRRYMVPADEHTPLPPHCHIQPIRVAGNNRCHLHQQKRYTYGHSSHHLGHPLPDCRIGRLHPAYDSGTARSRPCTDTGLFRPDAGQQIQRRQSVGNARLPHRHHRRVVLHALGHHPRPLSRSLCRRTDGRQQDRPGLEIGAGLAAWILAGHSSEMCDVCVLLLGVRQSLGLTPAPFLPPGNNLSPDHLPHGSPSA